ncbi:glycosyltransferase family 4 protein [Amylibacter sp. SFDW26]|uniref:glycosyltransferase family 4 protein n=1 Tax=Amylibacter sp. SFDW26 TaxID=2652722 RepID=UPI00126155F6|nr:glycosyltransferase family 4 protein [Amylibacter sp. SFDW26]KAB7609845.1 glycosyltransferase family 4 protein [Amylibacter sp. SFDW26]
MKILLTHRYYWPDTAPYALMLRIIAQHFSSKGHDVNVFASKVSYRDMQNADDTSEADKKIKVHRTWVFNESTRNPLIRILNVIIYCVTLCLHILRTKPDVVTASTFPPVIAAWFASWASRIVGAKFIYHMMDIHPEVSEYSGGLLGRRLPAKILRAMDNQTLKRSFAIVVLSNDMGTTLKARSIGELPIHVISNFMLDSTMDVAPPAELVKQSGKIRVIFAGNLGRYQNLDLLVEGVAKCFPDYPNLELLLLGDGILLPSLKRKWEHHSQVKFGPFLPFAQARSLIRDADIGVISLSSNIYKVASPSKTQTYLGLSLPVMLMVEAKSELAKTVENNNLGSVVANIDPEGVSLALKKHIDCPFDRNNISEWYEDNVSSAVALSKFSKLLQER